MSLFGNHLTPTLADIYPDVATFKQSYSDSGFPAILKITGNYTMDTIYALLMSEFGFSHIKGSNRDSFELRLMRIIALEGPVWQREMEMRDKIIGLTDAQLELGGKTINNHAMHPDTAPSTDTTSELPYIDDQNVSHWMKDPVRKFREAVEGLDDTITSRFLAKFRPLFVVVQYNDGMLLYESEEEEDV